MCEIEALETICPRCMGHAYVKVECTHYCSLAEKHDIAALDCPRRYNYPWARFIQPHPVCAKCLKKEKEEKESEAASNK